MYIISHVYYFTSTRLQKQSKADNYKCQGECGENENTWTTGYIVKWCNVFTKKTVPLTVKH
jgi:hypothetical protein